MTTGPSIAGASGRHVLPPQRVRFPAIGLGTRFLTSHIAAESLLVAMLVQVFGMAPPNFRQLQFGSREYEAVISGVAAGNIANQVIFSTLALIAAMILATNSDLIGRYSKLLWTLGLTLALCAASALWAAHPDISIRRSVLLILTTFTLLIAVANTRSVERAVLILYLVLLAALVLNLITVPMPGVYNADGNFAGIAGHKNSMGAVALIGVFASYVARPFLRTWPAKLVNLLAIAAWIGLLALSVSKTSIALAMISPIGFLAIFGLAKALRIRLLWLLLFLTVNAGVGIALLMIGFSYSIEDVLGLFVSDPGLTGRDVIWQFIFNSLREHWLLGHGFGSYWGVGDDSPNLKTVHSFIRLLTQAHNGYLELLLAVGVFGLSFLLLNLGQYVALLDRVRGLNRPIFQFAGILFVSSVLYNLTESMFLRVLSPNWTVFLLAFFLLAKVVADAARDAEA